MIKFFWGSHWSRVHTAALGACIYAGAILPLIDLQAAMEAGWSAVAWSITYMVGAAIGFYALVLEHRQYKKSTKIQSIG